jgi:hypothetical protein
MSDGAAFMLTLIVFLGFVSLASGMLAIAERINALVKTFRDKQ